MQKKSKTLNGWEESAVIICAVREVLGTKKSDNKLIPLIVLVREVVEKIGSPDALPRVIGHKLTRMGFTRRATPKGMAIRVGQDEQLEEDYLVRLEPSGIWTDSVQPELLAAARELLERQNKWKDPLPMVSPPVEVNPALRALIAAAKQEEKEEACKIQHK